jgi:hypothetical protein
MSFEDFVRSCHLTRGIWLHNNITHYCWHLVDRDKRRIVVEGAQECSLAGDIACGQYTSTVIPSGIELPAKNWGKVLKDLENTTDGKGKDQ